MTTIKCACGNPMCVIKIVVEDDQHIMLTGKDGEESLMYFCDETREALSHALNFSRAEAAEDRIAQLEADCANLKMIMSAGDAHMAALTAERDEARRQLEQARQVIKSLYNAWEDAPLEITRRTDRMDAMINAQSMIFARSDDPH